MRLLIWLGHDVDHLDSVVFTDLTWRAMLTRPLMCQPGRSFFIWIRILVVFPFEAKRLIFPRQLQDLKDFLKRLTVTNVDVALIASSGTDVNLLRHLIEPAGLIATGEPDMRSAFGELVQPSNLKGESQGVPARQDVADRANLKR